MSDLYQAVLLDELKHPQHKQSLPDPDSVAQAANVSCGDDLTVYLKFGSDQTILDIGWQGNGCAIAQVTMSLLSAHIQGKRVKDVMALTQSDLESLIGIKQISLGRVKCLMLGLEAVQRAIQKTKK